MRRHHPGVAALVALLAVAIAPLLVASPAEAGDPDVGRPEVGSCHDLNGRQAAQETDPRDAVDCTAPHTSVTTAVPDKPQNYVWGTKRLLNWSVTRCEEEVISFFGGHDTERLARSAYELLFFYPTPAERADGAKWVRCDLSLRGDRALQPLPVDGEARLGRLTDEVALCLAPPHKDYLHTVCARPHAYRAISTVRSKKGHYPSYRSWLKLGRRCPSRAPYYFHPDEPTYAAGDTYLVCLAKTSR